jgi:hypothetical protein
MTEFRLLAEPTYGDPNDKTTELLNFCLSGAKKSKMSR